MHIPGSNLITFIAAKSFVDNRFAYNIKINGLNSNIEYIIRKMSKKNLMKSKSIEQWKKL